MNRVSAAINTFKSELEKARAEKKGEARSQATRIKPLSEVVKPSTLAEARAASGGRPQPTDEILKDKRGRIFRYYTDGSLRRERQ